MAEKLIVGELPAIRELCKKLSVKELRVFGSAVTGHFQTDSSDIDLLVEFLDPSASGIADRYMALADGLESVFRRPVDLVTRQAIKNPVFRKVVEEGSEELYAA